MSPVVLIVALVFGLVAAAYYARALQQAQPHLSPSSRGPLTTWGALDAVIWFRSIPAQARRNYVMSLAYSCIFIACIGILAYREGSRVVAVVVTGIALLGSAMTVARWMRLRSQG